MRLPHWFFAIFLILASQPHKVEAHFCQEIYKVQQVPQNHLFEEIYNYQANLPTRIIEAKNTKTPVQEEAKLFNEFADIYVRTITEKVDSSNIIDFYRSIKDVLNHYGFLELIKPYVAQPEFLKAFNKIFDHNHAPLFLSLRDKLSREKVYELYDQLLNLRSLNDGEHYTALNNGWWKVIWLARLSLTPEIALNDLMANFQNFSGIFQPKDPRMKKAQILGIMEHRPDIIDVVTQIPPNLRSKYRKLIKLHFYINKKYPPAIAFLQKLNHPPLRALSRRLQHLRNEGPLTKEQVIKEIDLYWLQNGNLTATELHPNKPRGGYSFKKVLDASFAVQRVLADFTGFLGFGQRHHLILFGSFPNGMATFRNENSRTEFQSDFDVTFHKNQQFFNQNIQGPEWFIKAERSGKLYQLVKHLEQSILESLGVEITQGGHWISPMTQFPREQILEKKQFGHGAYPMLSSPIAIEISPSRILLYIHVLPKNATEVETLAFEISNH